MMTCLTITSKRTGLRTADFGLPKKNHLFGFSNAMRTIYRDQPLALPKHQLNKLNTMQTIHREQQLVFISQNLTKNWRKTHATKRFHKIPTQVRHTLCVENLYGHQTKTKENKAPLQIVWNRMPAPRERMDPP